MIPATYTPPNLGDLATEPVVYHKCGPRCSDAFVVLPKKVDALTASASSSTYEQNDLVLREFATAPIRSDFYVSVARRETVNLAEKAVTVRSSDTSVLADPVDGVCQGVASGKASVIASSDDGELSAVEVEVEVSASAVRTYWDGAVSGSLLRHCNDQIESRTVSVGRSTMPIWSTRNDGDSSYIWNPDCWGATITNLGCISPYNTRTGRGGGGVLVSPRHAIFCRHLGYHPAVGTTVRYVKSNGQVESAIVSAVAIHPYAVGFSVPFHDIVVCKFDRDVSVPFAKVLPADPSSYLPSIPGDYDEVYSNSFPSDGNGNRVYINACHTNQDKVLAVSKLEILPTSPTPYVAPGSVSPRAGYVRHATGIGEHPLGQTIRTGDSGAAAFIVVNNELVAMNVWTTPDAGYGFYTDATVINGMLDELGGGYNLTEADLSEFPTY